MAATARGFLRPTTTPTPDEIFDIWLSELKGSELKVLLYIVRRTFGFKKDSDTISLTQICEGITTRDGRVLDRGTGLSRTSASNAVKKLEKLGLIVVNRSQDKGGEHDVNTYRLRFRGFDDDPEKDGEKDAGEGDGEGSPKTGPGVVQKSDHPGSKNGPPVVQKLDSQQTESQETDSQQTEQQTAPPPESGESTESADTGKPQAGAGGGLSDEADSVSPQAEKPEQDSEPPSKSPPSVPEKPESEAVEKLVAFGVFRRRAKTLAASLKLSPEMVERACAALDGEIKAGASITNRAAVLVSRLEDGWEPPEPEKPDDPTNSKYALDDDWEWEPPPKPERPPLPEVVDAQGQSHDAYEWFETLKRIFEMQLPRETYDTWIRRAELADYQPPGEDSPPVMTIRLHNTYALEWVKHRLDKIVARELERMLGVDVERLYISPDAEGEEDTQQAA